MHTAVPIEVDLSSIGNQLREYDLKREKDMGSYYGVSMTPSLSQLWQRH